MSIKPDYLPLDSLLQKRLFRIPEYQRVYSWEEKQRKDLFDDIQSLQQYESERHHFMATIVCLYTSTKEEIGVDEFSVFHIVDGQQRLTTLIILLKALAKRLRNGDDNEKKEADKLDELLVKADQRLILLQTNHDSSFIFRNYLKEGTIPERSSIKIAAERNLIQAFEECESFVEGWPTGPLALLKVLKNRLDFIFYVLEDEGAVYRIFEVLNSRGLEVDWLDKCKSMLMGLAFEKFEPNVREEHINELHKRWTKIYQTIGLRKIAGHEILRFVATLTDPELKSKIVSAEEAVGFFRRYCEANPEKIIKVTDDFLKIAGKLERLYANLRLRAVTDIVHARLLAVAILLNESLNDGEQNEILDHWQKVTYRIFSLCGKDSRTKVGDYTRLAQNIVTNKIPKQDIIHRVDSLADQHSIDDGIRRLATVDCYNDWPNEDLLYFFYRYEEHLAEKAGVEIGQEVWEGIWSISSTKTIEHIHPQTPGPEWQGKLGEHEELEKQVHRLGNLMILPPGVNSKAWNKSFKEKKKIYRQNRHLKLMEEVIAKRDWNKKTIDARERKLLHWAKSTWS